MNTDGAEPRSYIQLTKKSKHMNVKDLKPGHSIFGNKGNVWSNTAHIYKSGEGNLCGTPALSNNWARIEDVQTIGCPKCLALYNNEPSNDDYIQQLAQNMVDMSK